MTFRLVDSKWDREFRDALQADNAGLRIICPFIKHGPVERLLKHGRPKMLQVITRFNDRDFYEGVSDLTALRLLRKNGAQIRGVRNLHAKLYLFGETRAIVTSANLTAAALLKNHEFGFIAEDALIIERCREYFDGLWRRAGPDLDDTSLIECERRIESCLSAGSGPANPLGLLDFGTDVGLSSKAPATWFDDASHGFVKFFGSSNNRLEKSTSILDVLHDTGCHWACSYSKRPQQVRDGDVMFMGRFVNDPPDNLIFGRAIGMRHKPGQDEATDADKQRRDWKKQRPHYICVHHAEFIAGPLSNGISLNELMNALRSDAFASTQRNAAARKGNNTDPRAAYRRHGGVELSVQAIEWLTSRLEAAFVEHGKLALGELKLDWPENAEATV
jgi:hypothetical protein